MSKEQRSSATKSREWRGNFMIGAFLKVLENFEHLLMSKL